MTDRRDTIALETLRILLPSCDGVHMSDVATQCYDMADAMETARGTTDDTARLDWLLAMLTDPDMALAFNRCLAIGMVGREAIDAAAKRHPL